MRLGTGGGRLDRHEQGMGRGSMPRGRRWPSIPLRHEVSERSRGVEPWTGWTPGRLDRVEPGGPGRSSSVVTGSSAGTVKAVGT